MILRDRELCKDDKAKGLEIRSILGLDPDLSELTVSYSPMSLGGSHIGIQTRSMMKIMVALSTRVDSDAKDPDEGRAVKAPDEYNVLFSEFNIMQGDKKPDNDLVSVPWFWIDDCDLGSKFIFALVMILNTQMEASGADAVPLVTIPAG